MIGAKSDALYHHLRELWAAQSCWACSSPGAASERLYSVTAVLTPQEK